MRITGRLTLLLISLLAGCAHQNSNPNQLPHPQTALPPVDSPAASPASEAQAAAGQPKPEAAQSAESTVPAAVASPASHGVAKGKPKKATASPSAVTAVSAPSANPKPQLDFKLLEQRLRETSAIGVFTKLSIKNQVDDLLNAFRGYYAGHTPPSLDDLHQRYDGLLLKVVSLVQDGDATLASDVSASRNAIWEKLSKRETFQEI